jgi:arginyl-tRNA synthetase
MNPIGDAKFELAKSVGFILKVDEGTVLKYITYPPRKEQGDLSIPLPQISKSYKDKIEELKTIKGNLIGRVEISGIYLNTFLDEKNLFHEAIMSIGDDYGIEKVETPLNIVVEHTSANPIHPLHIGHLRNSILGDVVARMLRARGHNVNVRFYVNDTGRQVAILIYGLKKLGYPDPPSGVKKDYWLGQIYAMTNVIMEIHRLKLEVDNTEDEKERREKLSKLDDMVGSANSLRERMPEVFDNLAESMKGEDHEKEVSKIIELYEGGNKEIKEVVRKYVGYALEGFIESLNKLHISFDTFDFESDLIWSGEVSKVIKSLSSSPARMEYKGALALDLQNYVDQEVRKDLSIPEGLEIPPLVLMRSDGTTLYTTRDIAYTLLKFRQFNATKVINVIAEQQMIPQIQLRAALYLAGFKKEASNLIHYSYGMVNLQGMRMSGRLGKYISLDEIYTMITEIAKAKVKEKRGAMESVDEVVNSAIRYPILSVAPNKPVSFNVDNVVSFEQNSGPYLQYTYARAFNVLAKNQEQLDERSVNYEDIVDEKREILMMASKFPEVFSKACDELAPEDLVAFLRHLADTFNKWYDKERILQEPDKGKRMTRLYIVKGVETILRNGLGVLGISPLKRM